MVQFIRYSLLTLGLLLGFLGQSVAQELAQYPVPRTLDFAGITLRIDEDAQSLISKNIWLLRKNEAYFNSTVERVDLYLPLLERVLAEEGLPDDFKYLAVQESSLISDVVSKSNAVGYWQFKQASALEVGLQVDNKVDERKHILASTRGAAKYMKRNNYYLNNWMSALLSHYAGLGGAKTLIPSSWANATKIDIDKNTHWYILKYLAHKIAFEEAVKQNPRPNMVLLEYSKANGKSMRDVAKELNLAEEDLLFYNKWLGASRVPEEKIYTVIIPAPAAQLQDLIAKTGSPYRPLDAGSVAVASVTPEPVVTTAAGGAVFPVLKKRREDRMYFINGKLGIQAKAGDSAARLAELGGLTKERFLRLNDLSPSDRIIPGQVYYLKKKKARASVAEHVVVEGETLWEISHRYGITMKALLRKNRMRFAEKPKHGQVLWLRSTRPSSTPVEIRNIPKPAPAVMVAQNQPGSKPKLSPEKVVKSAEKVDMPTAPVINESPKVTDTPAPQKEVKETVAVSTPTAEPSSTPKEPIAKVEEKALYPGPSNPASPVIPPASTPVSTPVANPAPASGVTVKPGDKTHTVDQGQTLYAISRMYGAKIADIRAWNGLSEADGVKIGQVLIVARGGNPVDSTAVAAPAKVAGEEFTEYVVQPGDTVYKISRAYGVSVQDLLSWNGKTDPSLSLGEKLKVKKSK